MTLLVNSFEGGTNATTITTGNSGGASGNAFDAILIGGGTLAYSNTVAAHGSLSAEFSGTSVDNFLEWSTSMGTQTQVWFRFYAYFPSMPTAEFAIFRAYNSSTQSAGVDINGPTGTVRVRDSSNTTISTSVNAIPLNQWFRVEGFFTFSATAGQTQVKLFFGNEDSIVPTEVNTTSATQNTGSQATNCRYGIDNSTNALTFYMDDIGLSSTGYLGPSNTAIVYPQTGPVQARIPQVFSKGRIYSSPVVVPVTIVNTAEGGTSGTPASPANTGGSSGNSFDVVNIGSGATVAFDNTHYAHGSLSYKIATGASGVQADLDWNSSFGNNQTKVWFRYYLYFTANPVNNHRIAEFYTALTSGATVAGGLVINTAGHLYMVDGGGTPRITSTHAIPLNQWFRVEGFILGNNGSGQLSFSLFSPQMDSTIALETQLATGLSTTGPMDGVRIGPGAFSIANVGPFWIDDIGHSNVGYLGPSGNIPVPPLQSPVQAKFPQQPVLRGRISSNPGAPVPLLLTNSFEGGTNGVTITSGNSGGASGNAWNGLVIDGGGSAVYSTAEYAHGGLSGEFATVASGHAYTFWNLNNQQKIWFRFYVYLTSYPASFIELLAVYSNSGALLAGTVKVINTGILQFVTQIATPIGTTEAVPLNQWVRVEGWITASPNIGQVSFSLFTPLDSQVPVETHTSTATQNTTGPMFLARFGQTTAAPTIGPFWMDNLGISNTGPLGPAAFPGNASSGMPGSAIQPRIPQNGPRGRITGITAPKVIQLTNNAQGGTSGATVTRANSGDLSGNAFDALAINAGTSIIFDNTEVAHSSELLAYRVATTSTSTGVFAEWTTSLAGSYPVLWFRAYLYYTNFPAVGSSPVRVQSGAGVYAASIAISSAGKIQLRDSAFSSHFTFSNSVPLNQWFRIEGYFVGNSTAGIVSCSLFYPKDSGNPIEAHTSPGINTLGTLTSIYFGETNSGINEGPWWFGDIGVSTAGYLGSSALPSGAFFPSWANPIRARIPQNAPRGRTYGAYDKSFIILRSLAISTGEPYTQWIAGSATMQWRIP